MLKRNDQIFKEKTLSPPWVRVQCPAALFGGINVGLPVGIAIDKRCFQQDHQLGLLAGTGIDPEQIA